MGVIGYDFLPELFLVCINLAQGRNSFSSLSVVSLGYFGVQNVALGGVEFEFTVRRLSFWVHATL